MRCDGSTYRDSLCAIAYQEFKNEKAVILLKEFCLHDNLDIVLLSINMLMYVGEKQPFVETVRATYEMTGRDYNVKAAGMDFLGSLGLGPNNFDYED